MNELLGQDGSVFQVRPGIQVSDIKAMANKLQINITGSKTDQERIGEVIVLERVVRYPALCPVLSVRQLLNKIHLALVLYSSIMMVQNLPAINFMQCLKRLQNFLGWNSKGFTSHSFRIGAATTAIMNGVPKEVLMLMGRWKSNAVNSYIRPI